MDAAHCPKSQNACIPDGVWTAVKYKLRSYFFRNQTSAALLAGYGDAAEGVHPPHRGNAAECFYKRRDLIRVLSDTVVCILPYYDYYYNLSM